MEYAWQFMQRMPKLVGGSGIPFIFCPKIVLIAVYVAFVPDGSTGWWYNISYFCPNNQQKIKTAGKMQRTSSECDNLRSENTGSDKRA